MKLIFCPECKDMVKLTDWVRTCQCGKSEGCYVGERNISISGKAVPIGIAWHSLSQALADRPKDGAGARFDAFVIPEQCDTVEET